MKNILFTTIGLCAFLSFVSAQCTSAGQGQYPNSVVQLNSTCIAKIITTHYTDEYSVVSGVEAQTYEFKSSNTNDFLTIADLSNNPIAWGTGL